MPKNKPSSVLKNTTNSKTLVFKRRSTKQGVHPYDMFEWESRDVVMHNWRDNTINFSQYGVEFPSHWSQNASSIITSKYFRGKMNTASRENSLKQVINRVVDTYAAAAIKYSYMDAKNAAIFSDELKYALVDQQFAFNSPVWFNVGTSSPQQVSACYILKLEDTMESILNWYVEEGLIFKGGSGAGISLSPIRSSKELLSNGGHPSGPVSFMRGADASAGTIKSGGACLAPWTLVYTENGPKAVKELADSVDDFITVSYNPILKRVQATNARAWLSGQKQLVRVNTDKGQFTLSADHPVMLMSGGYKLVSELKPGMSIRPANVTANQMGYHRVGLHNGLKGKESVHRLIAKDVLGLDIDSMEVHHKDRNPANNSTSNLQVLSRSEHDSLHSLEDIASGVHPFLRYHGKGNHQDIAGDANGMSHVSGNRTEEYKTARDLGMRKAGVYEIGQHAAAEQRMLNMAYKIVNEADGSIDTFDEYFAGRLKISGRMGYSKAEQLKKIQKRFGSYESFKEEVRANNHTVTSLEMLDISDVYDVEVDNDTPRDKSDQDGHNFMIISETNNQIGYTGIFVSNSRRAAKMVILDVDHPDIAEFIETKELEERKIRALREAGFDMDMAGKDINSVQFQNANNSVRVNDAFMKAVAKNEKWSLLSQKGEEIESVSATALWDSIARAAWACADPGVQYDGEIQRMHTLPNAGRISASNPCAEYYSLDNSSCNLASVRLTKFYDADTGTFDVQGFSYLVRLMTVAMDISICFGHSPTKEIDRITKVIRTLGVGFTDLGAMLMSAGAGYDSPLGRAWAASITSLMSASAYAASAEIAGVVGSFDYFASNKDPMVGVLGIHLASAEQSLALMDSTLSEQERQRSGNVMEVINSSIPAWGIAAASARSGFMRNAQISVCAPTGTISFFLDADTTGVEPDLGLIKSKKLSTGGSLKIVNQTVPASLARLGYSPAVVGAILDHINLTGQVLGAPGFNPEHDSVFATAMGTNVISPDGHLNMMAAIQPFISGAISKTINLPHDATVEDVKYVYQRAWELGLKAVSIYRDGCKVGQPMTVQGATAASVKKDEAVAHVPMRKRLPRTRDAITTSFTIGSAEGYITMGKYEDGSLGEVFIKMSKQGSTLSGVMDALAISISIGLQYGVPVETFIAKFINSRFEPAGLTDDTEIRMASSVLDYIAKKLAIEFCDPETRDSLGVKSSTERVAALDATGYGDVKVMESAEALASSTGSTSLTLPIATATTVDSDAPLCYECGIKMQRAGSCYVCPDCSATSGCS